MKKYYAKGDIPTARQIRAAEGFDAVSGFARQTGYPIIAKPDVGVGASGTYKIEDDEQLQSFYETESNYRNYVVEEFITGEICSYDAGNFFFRRPDLFDTLLALSGLYYAGYFFPNYQDSLIYDNSPQDFLRQMPDDHPYWHIYRQRRIVMCVGQGAWEDELLDSTRQMDALLKEKNVPAWIDYWGYDSAHDWAWWRKQIVYFMDHLLTEETVEYVI